MSIPRKIAVKCSKCESEIEVTVFESINTDYAPDITEQIIKGDLFCVKCPKCGFVSHLAYDFLYHDIKHGAMIWVLHDNTAEYSKRVAELRSSANVLSYKTTRIVNNTYALREKVACLENNRDDRIIELCKVFVTYNLLAKQPDFDFNNAFYTTFLGKERIFFYDKNGQELSCELTEDTYSLLKDMYYNSEYAAEFNDYYAIVDYEWADNIIQPLAKQEVGRIDAKNTTGEQSVVSEVEGEDKKEDIICPKCKQMLPDDSEFCHYCGTPIHALVNSQNISRVVHEDNHSKKKIVIVLLVVLLAIALIVGIRIFLKKNEPDYYYDSTDPGVAPSVNTTNPNNIISYDVTRVRIVADSGGGVGDVYSHLIEHEDYLILDSKVGQVYDVNYKIIGGVGVTHLERNGKVLKPAYGPIEDWWYNVTLPDGRKGFVWGGTDGMYIEEIID